jgi:hypothetical protein
MAQKTVIMEIVKGLDRSQATFVRARLRGQKRRLYDFYSTSKNPENILGAQKAAGCQGNAFASLKAKLETELVGYLGEYARKKSPSQSLKAAMCLMEGYLSCGQSALAAQQVHSAFRLAAEVEDFAASRALIQTIDLYFAASSATISQQDREQAVALAELLHAADAVKRLPQGEMVPAATVMYQRLQAIPPPVGRKALLLYLRATIISLVIQRRLQACLDHCIEIQRIWEQHRFLLHDPTVLAVATAALNVHAAVEQQTAEAGTANAHATQLVAILQQEGITVPGALDLFQLLLDLEQTQWSKDCRKTDVLLKKLSQLLHGAAVTDEKRLAKLLCVAAGALISQQRYHEALDWLRQLYKRRATELFEIWSAIAALMELTCHFTLADYEELLLCVRRAKRRMKLANTGNDFVEIVTKAFSKLGEEPQQAKSHLQHMVASLGKLDGDPSAQLLMEGFDLKGWAVSVKG